MTKLDKLSLSVFAFALILCLCGIASGELSFSTFEHSYTVASNPSYVLYWNLTDSEIVFGLDVASNSQWVGLGIAEPTTGSMPGADMAILQVQSGSVTLKDYYAIAKEYPIEDTCQSFILVTSAITPSGNVQAIFRRLLNTSDSQDRVINTQVGYSTKMVWATGNSGTLSYHGNTKRGAFGVFLNGGEPGPVNSSWNSWTISMPAYTVPAKPTTYTCFSAPMPQDGAYYIKRFEFINSNTLVNSQVHHILLYSCSNTANGEYQFYLNNPSACFQTNTGVCTDLLYLWVPGSNVMEMPDDVSFAMGTATAGARFALMQIHYTNPNSIAGERDSSGVKIYYDSVPTTHLAGVMQLGDPLFKGTPILPGKAASHYEYTCPGQCSSNLPNSINIFADALHMHAHGSMMYSTITSVTTGETTSLNRAEYYDYGFQSATFMNHVLVPGDRINTHCIFDTRGSSVEIPFSTGTENEMCVEFLFYYPRISSPFCGFYKQVSSGSNSTLCGTSVMQVTNPVTVDDPKFRTKLFGAAPKVGTCAAAAENPTDSPTNSPSPAPTQRNSAVTAASSAGFFCVLMSLVWL